MLIHDFPKVEGDPQYTNAVLRYERTKDGKYFVTSDFGGWVILDENEFELLKTGRVHEDMKLFEELEKRGIIITERNVREVARMCSRKKIPLCGNPSLHIVVVTKRCNQACIYCHSASLPEHRKDTDMDEDVAKAVVDFIFQTPARDIAIEFQGGEPLLNVDTILFIADYANTLKKKAKKFVSYALPTNLTLMDEDLAKELFEKRKIGITTSLDGPKEIHDKNRPMRGGGSSYEDVVRWMDYFYEKYNYVVNAILTITKYSIPHAKEIVDEYVERRQKHIWFRHANYIGYAVDSWRKIGYTPEEYNAFWDEGLDYIIELNSQGKTDIRELYTIIILKKLFSSSDPFFVDLMAPCGAGIGQIAYGHDGTVYTCDEGRMVEEFKIGNVFEDTLQDVLLGERLIKFHQASVLESYPTCELCVWKPFCGTCPVASYTAQGTPVPIMPEFYRCAIQKHAFEYILEKWRTDEKAREVFRRWLLKASAI